MLAGLGVIALVAAFVLLFDPRHRTVPSARSSPPPTSRAAGGPAPADRASPTTPAGDAGPARAAVIVVGGKRIPAPDRNGQVRVAVIDDAPWRLPLEGVPPGWDLHEFAGHASVEVVRSDGRVAMRLRSERSSFVLSRDVVLEPRHFPYLTWSWRVMKLPVNGDVRDPARDDQAAQVYVVFPRWPSPRTASDVLGYVWDTRAPVGTRQVSPRAGNVRVLVVESGRGRLGSWQVQQRNVVDDYVAVFGHEPPRVGKVAVMIDTNDTRGDAEALVGDLIFSRTPARRTEITTTVLR